MSKVSKKLIITMNILAWLFKKIGGVPAEEREGKEVDYDKVFCLKINDKNKFIAWLIDCLPDGSVWSVEGIYNPKIIDILSRIVWDPATGTNGKSKTSKA